MRRSCARPSAGGPRGVTGGGEPGEACLAALAIEYQAELQSTDADFARFPGLRWVNPLRR